MSALGDELKRQRERRLFSMCHLAKLVGHNHSLISRIERGDSTTVEVLAELSGALGTDPASRWDAFRGLFVAWLADRGIATNDGVIELQVMLPYLPERTRSEVEGTLNLLRSHAGLVLERARMADDGCPRHEE